MDGTSAAAGGRASPLPAFLISLVAAGVFLAAAWWVGEAPPLAIWGGAVWVFVLSTIVTLPLVIGRRPRRQDRPVAGDGGSTMSMALMVWLCALPFVFLLVAPLLGLRAAVTAALLMLVGISALCVGVCLWKLPPGQPRR